jgi:uncharacterized damage-inducible protein DinB
MEQSHYSVGMLKGALGLFAKDLDALPEEAFTKKFTAEARSVADIVFEVNLVNDHVGMVIRGEKPFDWPDGGWILAPDGFDTKSVVIDAYKESMNRILQTAMTFTPDELEAQFETEEGTTTRAERLRFMALHLWYHSGQLNFIQTLLGDTAWHWQ